MPENEVADPQGPATPSQSYESRLAVVILVMGMTRHTVMATIAKAVVAVTMPVTMMMMTAMTAAVTSAGAHLRIAPMGGG